MKFFVDTAEINQIAELNALGMVDGVTTNPSLIMKSGRDIIGVTREICSIVSGPVSAEVTAIEAEGMIETRRIELMNKIEQIYQRPKSLILGEVRYPSNMFTKYTDAEKAAIGIYPVEDSGTKGDDRFENTSQATYTWSASDKKVTTSYTITEKSLVDIENKDALLASIFIFETDCAKL